MRFVLLLFVSLFVISAPVSAERYQRPVTSLAVAKLKCKTTLDAARLGNVLYKNQNIHGGRGRTFLDQGHRFYGARTLRVAGTNGTIFGCFGLFRCDSPYGCRYYQAMCHDGLSNSAFAATARRNGGTTMALVSNGGGLCIKINAASARYGSVHN